MASSQDRELTIASSATARTTFVPPLLRLPPELTERIAEALGAHHSSGKPDVRALRLTCKDIYLKTFDLFGRLHFKSIPVTLTRSSLQRLQALSQHRSIAQLSLSKYVERIVFLTFRLPLGNGLERIFSDFNSREVAFAIADGISLACQAGLENHSVPGPYNSRIHAFIEEYRNAAVDQQAVTSANYDVDVLARAIAAFPAFHSALIKCDTNTLHPELYWSKFTGMKCESFSALEDDISGQRNPGYMLNRVFLAIGQASSLCQAQERTLKLRTLEVDCYSMQETDSFDSRPFVSLQSLEMRTHQESLHAALCQLESLSIGLKAFAKAEEIESDVEAIKKAMQLLLSSRRINKLCIIFDDKGAELDSEMRSIEWPDRRWIGDHHFAAVVEFEVSDCLRHLELGGLTTCMLESAAQLVARHATTLDHLVILSANQWKSAIIDLRDLWKGILRAAAGCTNLSRFTVSVFNSREAIIDVNEKGADAVSERIEAMVESPTDRAFDYIWLDTDPIWIDVDPADEDSWRDEEISDDDESSIVDWMGEDP